MLTVTASHVSADYDSLIKQTTFAENTEYRVRGDAEHGFYASGPMLGCGRTCRTKELAIRDLLAANGYTAIHIEEAQPVRTSTVEDLKSAGMYFAAGALLFQLGYPRSYGCHYGFRSDLELSREEFYRGYDAAEKGARR